MVLEFDFRRANPEAAPLSTTKHRTSVSLPNTLHSWRNLGVRISECSRRCVRAQADYAGRIGIAAEIASVKHSRVARAWDPVARGSRCSRWLETRDGSGRVWFIDIWCCATDPHRPGGV